MGAKDPGTIGTRPPEPGAAGEPEPEVKGARAIVQNRDCPARPTRGHFAGQRTPATGICIVATMGTRNP